MFLTRCHFSPATPFKNQSHSHLAEHKRSRMRLVCGAAGVPSKSLCVWRREALAAGPFFTSALTHSLPRRALRDLYTQALPKCSACYSQYVPAPCVASLAACGFPLLEAACRQHVLPAGPPSALPSALPEGNISIAVCCRASLASAPCCCCCCSCCCSCSSPYVVTCLYRRRHAAALPAPQLQPRHASRPRAVGAAYAAAGYKTFVQHRFMLFLLFISFVFYLFAPRCTLTRCQLCRSSHQTRRRSGHSVCGWSYFFHFSSVCFSAAAATVAFLAASTSL